MNKYLSDKNQIDDFDKFISFINHLKSGAGYFDKWHYLETSFGENDALYNHFHEVLLNYNLVDEGEVGFMLKHKGRKMSKEDLVKIYNGRESNAIITNIHIRPNIKPTTNSNVQPIAAEAKKFKSPLVKAISFIITHIWQIFLSVAATVLAGFILYKLGWL